MSILQNISKVNENIKAAQSKADDLHKGKPVTLVAVTKNHGVQPIKEALGAGIIAIGENRVQEATAKFQELGSCAQWHLIGHLQTNKVRQAVPLFDLIHSVDSNHLAVEINRVAEKYQKRQKVLIQVNVSGEESKFGIQPGVLMELSRFVAELEYVELAGIMTIAPHYEQVERTRPLFREMYQLYMELQKVNLANTKIEWLSMGMTNDYTIAIEEGANLVRVGTGIFGQREY